MTDLSNTGWQQHGPYRIRVVELMDAAVNIKVLDGHDRSVITVTCASRYKERLLEAIKATLGGAHESS